MRITFFCLTFFLCTFFSYSQKKEVKLLFVGDAMQHMPQIHSAKNKDGTYRYDSCFYLLKNKISNADIACVNIETVLNTKSYSGYPTFSAPLEFAMSLKNTGFNLFALANNHAMDQGTQGLERTIDLLDSMGVKHTGTFKSADTRNLYYPLMCIKNKIRIAFVNYTYGTNGLKIKKPNIVNLIDTTCIKTDLRYAQLYKPDIIIAILHWGEEYRVLPTSQQQEIAKFLLKNGVRIIIGHHPHVVEPFSIYMKNDKINQLVYYSIGNFISNQNLKNTDGGMIIEIDISKESDDSPVVIESQKYSFIWVRKYYDKGKLKYTLIPTDISPEDIHPPLNAAEQQKMNQYVSNAVEIIKQNVP